MSCCHEASPGRGWDERFLRKFVCFFFLFFSIRIIKPVFEKGLTLAMQQDMPQFVEQTEAEDIRPASPDGHHQDSFTGVSQ